MKAETTFVPLSHLAQMLGVAEAWLKAEAEAERIPYLKTGRRLMFNPDAVRHALLNRTTVQREAAHVG